MDQVGILYMVKGVALYLWVTISENVLIKFLVWSALAIMGAICSPEHKYALGVMVMVYLVSLSLGLVRGKINQRYSSKRLFKGGLKLVGYAIMLLVGHAVDVAFHIEASVFFWIFLAFIITSDCISILENAYLLGFDVPIWAIKYLHVAQYNIQEKFKDTLGITETEESIENILHKKDDHIDRTNPEP